MNWTENIPSLSIQLLDGGNLRLEDTSFSEGAIVDVHPSQLRLMAERLGLVQDLSASDADLLRMERECTAALRAQLARLIPWLEMIEARAAQLHENIMGVSMNGHEDVHIEVAQSSALADIAEQVCMDAKAAMTEPSRVCHTAVPRGTVGDNQSSAENGATPKTGGVQDPQERVASPTSASGAHQAALL
jgi:hypothetical protein